METKDGETNLLGEITNKPEEYFKGKELLSVLRTDLKDAQMMDESWNELKGLVKRVDELKKKISENAEVKALKEKIKTLVERQDLLKEMIRIELLDAGRDEVENKDRILKLKQVLKDEKNKNKKNEPHPDQTSFNN